MIKSTVYILFASYSWQRNKGFRVASFHFEPISRQTRLFDRADKTLPLATSSLATHTKRKRFQRLPIFSASKPNSTKRSQNEDLTQPSNTEEKKKERDARQATRTAFVAEEKARRNIVGAFFLLAVTVALVLNFDSNPLPPFQDFPDSSSSTAAVTALSMESAVEQVTGKLVEASIPGSATDVAAVALGEGTAGVLGAGGVLIVKRLMSIAMQQEEAMLSTRQAKRKSVDKPLKDRFQNTLNLIDVPLEVTERRKEIPDMYGVSDVLAGGDYFLTRSAMLPLLESVGLPMSVANVGSVLLSMIPYQWLRVSNDRNRRRQQLPPTVQHRIDNVLGSKETNSSTKSKKESWHSSDNLQSTTTQNVYTNTIQAVERIEEKEKQKQKQDDGIDVVELFSDISRWLEYDVLRADCSGIFFPTNPGAESAFFGFVAALSSQLYGDLLYLYTDYGANSARIETRTRELRDWISLYANRCLSSAALFGVYETTRVPIRKGFQAFLSGGADGCLGSANFNLCMQTYMELNPPEATAEGQFRSFLTALFSVMDRLGVGESLSASFFGDAGFVETMRSIAVSFYSVYFNYLSFLPQFKFF